MPTHRELTQPVASAYLAMQAIVRRLWGLIPPLLLIGHWCVEVERHGSSPHTGNLLFPTRGNTQERLENIQLPVEMSR